MCSVTTIEEESRGALLALSEAEYQKVDAANMSVICHFERSAAHVKYEMEKTKVDSDTFKIGRLNHVAILQPKELTDNYAVLPEIRWNSKERKRKTVEALFRAGFLGEEHEIDEILKLKKEELTKVAQDYMSKDLIDGEMLSQCQSMSQAVWAHKNAKTLLETASKFEEIAIWTDDETGAKCKGRIDCYNERLGYLIDLKTTEDASFFSFRKSIERYGYHYQLSHYRNGLRALGYPVKAVLIIAVEKAPPYGVGIYALSDSALSSASLVVKDWLIKWQACRATNHWPGYQDAIQDMDLSEFAYQKMEAVGQ